MSIFKDKVLLITGGTGSFGNAVLRRFLDSDVREIRIFSRDEKKQDDMRHRLQNPKVKFYIGDVRDKRSIDGAMTGVDYVFSADATQAVPVLEKIEELTKGQMCDITINNVNIPDTEMTSILCTKDTGLVYFFSMATSFTKAALGAEGVGSDVTMLIGNGYTKGHAEITLQELRESEELRKIFTELYA